jgi:hypothetical protein
MQKTDNAWHYPDYTTSAATPFEQVTLVEVAEKEPLELSSPVSVVAAS